MPTSPQVNLSFDADLYSFVIEFSEVKSVNYQLAYTIPLAPTEADLTENEGEETIEQIPADQLAATAEDDQEKKKEIIQALTSSGQADDTGHFRAEHLAGTESASGEKYLHDVQRGQLTANVVGLDGQSYQLQLAFAFDDQDQLQIISQETRSKVQGAATDVANQDQASVSSLTGTQLGIDSTSPAGTTTTANSVFSQIKINPPLALAAALLISLGIVSLMIIIRRRRSTTHRARKSKTKATDQFNLPKM